MKPLRSLTTTLIGLAVLVSSSPAYACNERTGSSSAGGGISTVACDSSGTTSADAAVAVRLNATLTGKLENAMTAYRVSCARVITKAVRDRGFAQRAAVIAVTTAIVESSLRNYAEAVDYDSLGLFQQRGFWGSVADRTNPTSATDVFLDEMVRKHSSNSWAVVPAGQVAQTVQVSAFPDKYTIEAGDAAKIVAAVWMPVVERGTDVEAVTR